MLEKLSKMSAREAMIELMGSKPAYGELPRWLGKVAHAAGISFRTARSLWNDEIKNPDHLALRAIKDRARIAKAKRDAAIVADYFSRRAQALANIDEDFHRLDIDAFRAAARAVRGGDSS